MEYGISHSSSCFSINERKTTTPATSFFIPLNKSTQSKAIADTYNALGLPREEGGERSTESPNELQTSR